MTNNWWEEADNTVKCWTIFNYQEYDALYDALCAEKPTYKCWKKQRKWKEIINQKKLKIKHPNKVKIISCIKKN